MNDFPAEGGSRGRARTLARRVTGSFWFNLLCAVVVIALVQTFAVKLYYVPSESMATTLGTGDRILVERVGYDFSAPADGDVVVFDASDAWEAAPASSPNPLTQALRWVGGVVGIGPSLDHTLVKRVVAGPGSTVVCCDDAGRVTVDGVPEEGPYITDDLPFTAGALDCESVPASTRCFPAVDVPDDRFLVLGDNRSGSRDSVVDCRGRTETSPTLQAADCVRLVKRSDLVGRVVWIVSPLARWGSVENG